MPRVGVPTPALASFCDPASGVGPARVTPETCCEVARASPLLRRTSSPSSTYARGIRSPRSSWPPGLALWRVDAHERQDGPEGKRRSSLRSFVGGSGGRSGTGLTAVSVVCGFEAGPVLSSFTTSRLPNQRPKSAPTWRTGSNYSRTTLTSTLKSLLRTRETLRNRRNRATRKGGYNSSQAGTSGFYDTSTAEVALGTVTIVFSGVKLT